MSRTDAGPYSVPERAVDPPVVDGVAVEMCSAQDACCEWHAVDVVTLGDREHALCRSHWLAWDTASVERQCDLARQWGWAS